MSTSQERWAYFEKMKMGFLMGGITGASVGFLVGGMTVLQYGPGERGYLATIGQQMLQTGGFLGFIMSIGMLLRAEGEESVNNNTLLRSQKRLFGPTSLNPPVSLRAILNRPTIRIINQ